MQATICCTWRNSRVSARRYANPPGDRTRGTKSPRNSAALWAFNQESTITNHQRFTNQRSLITNELVVRRPSTSKLSPHLARPARLDGRFDDAERSHPLARLGARRAWPARARAWHGRPRARGPDHRLFEIGRAHV